MNSPVAGGVGPESFFSPGQAERGQAGAGRAAAAGVTAGACPGCAGGAGNQGDAGRGSCAGGACQRVKVVIRCKNRTRGRTGQVTETLCNLIL